MKIRTLVVLRHGPDSGGGDAVAVLTPQGIEKVKKTADGVSLLVDGKILVLSSPIIRARQTGDILASVLSADLVILDVLKNDRLSYGDSCKSQIEAEVAKNDEYLDVVVVTHYELVNGIILAFKKEFPAINFAITGPPNYGRGFVIDFQTGNIEIV